MRDHNFEILRLIHVPLDKHRIVCRPLKKRQSLSLNTLFFQYISCDVTLRNILSEISSFARAHVGINYEKRKENFPESISLFSAITEYAGIL